MESQSPEAPHRARRNVSRVTVVVWVVVGAALLTWLLVSTIRSPRQSSLDVDDAPAPLAEPEAAQ